MSSYRWSASDIPPQRGRRVILTGANSGIGFPAALELARHGATVILASRDPHKGTAAVERIRTEIPSGDVTFSQLDLASLESIRAFAARELASGQPLDLLINNAGVWAPPKRLETEDHFELQFGTNVLGHFALTALLFPALQRAAADIARAAPRIVTVASIAHKRAELRFTDLQYQGSYNSVASYGQSKLANLMLALELSRRLTGHQDRILSTAAHPGVAGTNLFQVGDFPRYERVLRRWGGHAINAVLNDQTEGALPTLFAATSREAVNGGYYGPQGLWETRGGDVGPARIAPQAQDTAAAAKLWAICEDLTGCRFLTSAP